MLRLQEKVDGERSVREAALADVSSAVAELRRAKRGDEDAFHVVALGEIAAVKARSIHWFPYDPVGVVNADP